MSASALEPLQTVMYTTAKADATLGGLITGVFDRVPAGQAFDYVRLGEGTEPSQETFGKTGVQPTITVHTFAGGQDKKRAVRIMSRLRQLFHNTKLAVSGFTNLRLECELSDVFEENDPDTPDQRIYHGVQRFRANLWA